MEETEKEVFYELMKEIFQPRNILIYLLVINLVNFTLMWYDKKEAEQSKWRIQEKTFFIISLLGGAVGRVNSECTLSTIRRKNGILNMDL